MSISSSALSPPLPLLLFISLSTDPIKDWKLFALKCTTDKLTCAHSLYRRKSPTTFTEETSMSKTLFSAAEVVNAALTDTGNTTDVREKYTRSQGRDRSENRCPDGAI